MSKASIKSRQVGKSRWKTAWCLWMPFSLISVAERGVVASISTREMVSSGILVGSKQRGDGGFCFQERKVKIEAAV